MNVLIFVPVYNCETQIRRVIESFAGISFGSKYSFLFIDNKSQDNSLQSILESIELFSINKCYVISNSSNYGLGGSHKIAVDFAKRHHFDILVTFHGDDQANPYQIESMVLRLEESQADCVLGSRFMRGSKLNGYSRIRVLGNLIFNALFSIRFRKSVSDMGSGLNVYRLEMFQKFNMSILPSDLTFNNALLAYTLKNDFKVIFFPIEWTELDQTSNAKLFRQSRKILLILAQFNFHLRANSFSSTPENHEYSLVNSKNGKFVK